MDYSKGKKLLCGGYTSYTPAGKALFVKSGRWYTTPQRGDIIYFYTSSLGRVSHVGLVIEVKKTGITYHIKTIEGNTSATKYFERNGGCVAVKSYSFTEKQVGGKNRINGFGRPRYGDDTCFVDELIEIEKAELDYLEKSRSAYQKDHSVLNKKSEGHGMDNYTKYGKWYGDVMGDKSAISWQWCQMFQCYCAAHACLNHKQKTIGWYQKDGRWRFRKDGKDISGQWLLEKNKWYVFDMSGNAIESDWFKDKSGWYYLKSDCSMMTSDWIEWKGKWYYLMADGVMAASAYVWYEKQKAYCYVDADGVWDGKYYDALPGPGCDVVK